MNGEVHFRTKLELEESPFQISSLKNHLWTLEVGTKWKYLWENKPNSVFIEKLGNAIVCKWNCLKISQMEWDPLFNDLLVVQDLCEEEKLGAVLRSLRQCMNSNNIISHPTGAKVSRRSKAHTVKLSALGINQCAVDVLLKVFSHMNLYWNQTKTKESS